MKIFLACLLPLALAASPSRVHAQALGQKKDAVFSIDRLMGVTSTHSSLEQDPGDDLENDATAISFGLRGPVSPELSPFDVPRFAFDYFVADSWSVGGSLGLFSIAPDEGSDVSGFLFAPRVGYAYAFGRVAGIWPRAGFTYHSLDIDDVYSENGLALTLEVPFTFSPAPHVAFHVGPSFDVDVFGSRDPDAPGPERGRKYRTFGISAGLLIWL